MTRTERLTPASHYFHSKGLRLHYSDWGNPDAPSLLLVHGARDHGRSWDAIADALRHDWHVMAIDLHGHGESEHVADGRYTVDDFIYDLAEAVEQLTEKPVSIVAHSMGGIVSVRYAGIYPENVRRLVCIEGMGIPHDIERARATVSAAEKMRFWIEHQRSVEASQPRRYASIDHAATRMMEDNPRLKPDLAYHLAHHGTNRANDGSYSWKFDRHMRVITPTDLRREEVHILWEQITCPVLFIYNSDTWSAFAEYSDDLRFFRNHELRLYDDSGHWVHHDHQADIIRDIRRFLA